MFRKATLSLVAVFAATSAAFGQKADSGAYVVRLGRDTLAVERYVRTPAQLTAEAVMRTPQTRAVKLTVTYKDDGSISWYEVLNTPIAGVPNSAPQLRLVATYVGDSVSVQEWVAAIPEKMRMMPGNARMEPLVLPFYSTYEGALRQARKAGTDTTTLTMLSAAGPLAYRVHWFGTDSVTLSNKDAGTLSARVDSTGHMTGLSGAGTTFKIAVNRIRWPDLAAYQKRYAALDAAGKPLGALSPRDTVDESVGLTAILVDYGRPSRRGRQIFGSLVPWGEVWRTGANAATQIQLDDTLFVAGVKVPKGKYTLWTIPGPRQWQLIINKQTKQWGTQYDAKQDLVRITLPVEHLTAPVETFTMDIKRTGDKTGVMTMAWERSRLVVPLRGM